MAMDEFEKVRSKMLKQTIKVKGGKDRKIYDQEKLVKHFAGLDLKVRGQKITVPYNRPWTRLAARIELDTKTRRSPARGDGKTELRVAPDLQSGPQFPARSVDLPRPTRWFRHLSESPRDRRFVQRAQRLGSQRSHVPFRSRSTASRSTASKNPNRPRIPNPPPPARPRRNRAWTDGI